MQIPVVLDTNVILSALLFGGKPRQILEMALRGKIQIYLSEPLTEEISAVLHRPKFRCTPEAIQIILSELIGIAQWVEPSQQLSIIDDDPDDNRVLECANEAQAEFLVTGDSHLLGIKKYGGIRIVTPDQFLTAIQHRG